MSDLKILPAILHDRNTGARPLAVSGPWKSNRHLQEADVYKVSGQVF